MALSHPSYFTVDDANNMSSVANAVREKFPGLTTFGMLDEAMSNFLSAHDRFHVSNYLPHMNEQTGNVFITRPKLNLSAPNLTYDRLLAPLNTTNPMSSAYMIRCLLDTHFSMQNILNVQSSPLLNSLSPWLIPACNALVGISGWPDIQMETEPTEGGYYSENQTYATGHDRLYKTYNFNLTFKDVPGSPIFHIFFYWLMYMAAVTLGDCVAYNFHIDKIRLDYTVSIYQFIMDPTRRYILKWGKATGCFPISLPIGEIFNFSEGSLFSEGSSKLTIPFVVNNVKYQDYLRLTEFNILAERYCPQIKEARVIKFNSPYNYVGLPYIVSTPKGFMLTYRDVNNSLPEEELESRGMFSSTSSYKVPNLNIGMNEERSSNVASADFDNTGFNFKFNEPAQAATDPAMA